MHLIRLSLELRKQQKLGLYTLSKNQETVGEILIFYWILIGY